MMCRCHLECQKEVCKQVITRLVCFQSVSTQSGLQICVPRIDLEGIMLLLHSSRSHGAVVL